MERPGVLRRLRPTRAFGRRRAYPPSAAPVWAAGAERTRMVPTFTVIRSAGPAPGYTPAASPRSRASWRTHFCLTSVWDRLRCPDARLLVLAVKPGTVQADQRGVQHLAGDFTAEAAAGAEYVDPRSPISAVQRAGRPGGATFGFNGSYLAISQIADDVAADEVEEGVL
jgi:hypothetical protein